MQGKFNCFVDGCLIKAGGNHEEMSDCLVGEGGRKWYRKREKEKWIMKEKFSIGL